MLTKETWQRSLGLGNAQAFVAIAHCIEDEGHKILYTSQEIKQKLRDKVLEYWRQWKGEEKKGQDQSSTEVQLREPNF
jgi:hypothetical protein